MITTTELVPISHYEVSDRSPIRYARSLVNGFGIGLIGHIELSYFGSGLPDMMMMPIKRDPHVFVLTLGSEGIDTFNQIMEDAYKEHIKTNPPILIEMHRHTGIDFQPHPKKSKRKGYGIHNPRR